MTGSADWSQAQQGDVAGQAVGKAGNLDLKFPSEEGERVGDVGVTGGGGSESPGHRSSLVRRA